MQVDMNRRGAEHSYMTIFLEGEIQHYRVHNQTGVVQRRFGLAEAPSWARVHPDRAGVVLAAVGTRSVA